MHFWQCRQADRLLSNYKTRSVVEECLLSHLDKIGTKVLYIAYMPIYCLYSVSIYYVLSTCSLRTVNMALLI